MTDKFFPTVSVIIPCYNVEDYLNDTVDSVISQSYSNWEIIIVDDYSTDDTFSIAESLALKDNRIKCFRIEHSGLPSVVRNYGAAKSAGDYLAFLDSDDIWYPNKLAEQINYFSKHKSFALVYSMSLSFGNVGFLSPRFEVLPLLHKACKNFEDLITKGNSITCSSVVLNRNIFNEIKGFDENPKLKAVEDFDLWLRIGRNFQIGFIPKILVKYRIHQSQVSDNFEINNKRLKTLASLRNLDIKPYKYRRSKSKAHLVLRNIFIFATICYVKTLSLFR